MGLFDREARGGFIGSKLDEQDGVAGLLVLETLADPNRRSKAFAVETTISCEVGDDILITTNDEIRIYSVKAARLSEAQIEDESLRLARRLSDLDPTRHSTRIVCLIGAQSADTERLSDSLNELKNVLASPAATDSALAGWSSQRPDIVNPDSFSVRVFGHHSFVDEQYRASAVRLLRKAVPLIDFDDSRADELISQLLSRLRDARLTRGTVSLSALAELLAKVTVPGEVQAILGFHINTRYGYVPDPKLAKSRENDSLMVSSAQKSARQRFHKALRKGLWKSIILGPVRCISCGGPLMGNLYGFIGGGIMCSHCGYMPYLSLLYGCECGDSVLLVEQPSSVQADLMLSIASAVGKSCACGRAVEAERINTRSFLAGMPWPPEKFGWGQLIADRKSAGLAGAGGLGADRIIKNYPPIT